MKKKWVEPKILVQQFVANEYVAACGASGVVYKFECNAPAGVIHYYPVSDGKIDGEYYGNGEAISRNRSYTPCGITHEASATDGFYDGFVDRNRNGKCDPGEEAIVWLEPEWSVLGYTQYNGHATTNLDMDTWETAKS